MPPHHHRRWGTKHFLAVALVVVVGLVLAVNVWLMQGVGASGKREAAGSSLVLDRPSTPEKTAAPTRRAYRPIPFKHQPGKLPRITSHFEAQQQYGLPGPDVAQPTLPPSTPDETPPEPPTAAPPVATPKPPPPSPTPMHLEPLCYNVHAFYYPWYRNRQHDGKWFHWNHPYMPHWQQEVTDQYPKGRHDADHDDIGASFFPSIGPYSSVDNDTIAFHMKCFVRARIGVLVLSWYSPGLADENGTPSDSIVPALLDIAAQYGVKIAFHSEPYGSRTAQTLRHDLEYIVDRYGSHPAMYRAGPHHLPVIYVYDPYHVSFNDWRGLFKVGDTSPLNVRGTKYDVIAIALVLKPEDEAYFSVSGFDGGYSYFASNTFSYASDWNHWQAITMETDAFGAFFVPSVGPGYDDLQVRPWNTENVKEREHGKFYNDSFWAALQAIPPTSRHINADATDGKEHWRPRWVSITSFNEWGEGTQIEPASSKPRSVHSTFANFDYKRYGVMVNGVESFDENYYLDLTRYWALEAPNAACDRHDLAPN